VTLMRQDSVQVRWKNVIWGLKVADVRIFIVNTHFLGT
jgi:hypothetical protein